MVISNTLFFDKCLGWRGVCFEPQTRYHGWIRRTRGCTLVPSCVLGSESVVSFEGVKGGSAAVKEAKKGANGAMQCVICLLYTSPSPRDRQKSRMPSSA